MARINPLSSGASEYEMGIKDLKKAYYLNPTNNEIKSKYNSVITQYNNQKKKDKEQFSGLFNRGEIIKNDEINHKEEKKESDENKINRLYKELQICQKIADNYRKEGNNKKADELEKEIKETRLKLYIQEKKLKKTKIDFNNATPEIIESAKQFGLDLNDKDIINVYIFKYSI